MLKFAIVFTSMTAKMYSSSSYYLPPINMYYYYSDISNSSIMLRKYDSWLNDRGDLLLLGIIYIVLYDCSFINALN